MTSAAELFNTLKYRIVVNPATGTRRYYNHANQLHREDGPAIEYSDGAKCWYRNGKLHREDGPAVIYHNGTRKWLLNGMPHRIGGPAIEYADGAGAWYLKGVQYTEELYHHRCKEAGHRCATKLCTKH